MKGQEAYDHRHDGLPCGCSPGYCGCDEEEGEGELRQVIKQAHKVYEQLQTVYKQQYGRNYQW